MDVFQKKGDELTCGGACTVCPLCNFLIFCPKKLWLAALLYETKHFFESNAPFSCNYANAFKIYLERG